MAGNGNNLEELSKQVNDMFNYVNEYKKRNIKANGNDMMALYKIVSEYNEKITGFMKNTRGQTDTGNQAQYMDLVARRADARENKRIIAEVIAESMQENVFDADGYKNKLSSLLSEKDKNKNEVKDLFMALTGYNNAMNNPSSNAVNKADAKVKLVNSCIGYIKNFRGNSDALNTVYDIAAVMGAQNIKAFESLKNEQLSSLFTKKYMGYQNTNNDFVAHHMSLNHAAQAPEKFDKLLSDIAGKSQQEKEVAYEKYLNYMYGSDRFAKYVDKEKVLKELGPDATEEEKFIKLGEKISEKMPWHNIKLDDTMTSKEKFARRQEVIRQWFPDDSALLFGAPADKNKARSFLDDLSNTTYNGYFRSRYNSPEYTALIDTLKVYTNNLEKNSVKDEENLKAVKDACTKYLKHYEDKDPKRKTEFAKMRRNKVRELLVTLGGNVEEIAKNSKEATKASKEITEDSKEKVKAPETFRRVQKVFKDTAQFRTMIENQEDQYSVSANKVVDQVNNGKKLDFRDLARAFVDRGVLNYLKDMGNQRINREAYRATVNKMRKTDYKKEIEKLMADPEFINSSKELKEGECSEEAINKLFVKYVKASNKSELDLTEKNTQKTAQNTTYVKKDIVSKGWVIG